MIFNLIIGYLIFHSIITVIVTGPIKMIVNKHYPEKSNLNRSLQAYRLAIGWPLIAFYAIMKHDEKDPPTDRPIGGC